MGMSKQPIVVDTSRRTFLNGAAAAAALIVSDGYLAQPAYATMLGTIHTEAAEAAKNLAAGRQVTLKILEPSGSLGNIKPVAERWTAATGINIQYIEVPLGEINQKVMLEAVSKSGAFDIALPASFGLPDQVEAGVLLNLDQYAQKYEPPGFRDDYLYSTGDFYKGSLYGYLTDGDTYSMFYLKDLLSSKDENKRFADKHGYGLKVPDTWEELDAMMAHFHRPEKGMYGGTLFRTQYFIAWEFWSRFHAKGFYPFDGDLNPQINNEAGIKALTELVNASKSQYPGAKTNGLFENFEAYGQGNSFCNIGWGGTQKYLNGPKSKVAGKLAFGNMPGGKVKGTLIRTPYFNWGWEYAVSAQSKEPEIAYLFALFAVSPAMSTIAVRDRDGYFDPFRAAHYKDPEIQLLYSADFLKVHEASMRDSIPDLYLKGQGEYFDELRVNIQAADSGQKSPKQALDDTASAWNRITRRMGKRSQLVQWTFLKSMYPAGIRKSLT